MLVLVGCRDATQAHLDPDSLQGEPIQPPAMQAANLDASSSPASGDAVVDVGVPPLLASDPASSSSAEPPPTGAGALDSAPETVETDEGSFMRVGFDRLSGFAIEIDETILNPQTNQVGTADVKTAEEQIPKPILALNNKPIALKGFMLPLKVEGGLVTELLIMKDQSMCCFGLTPQIHEWVSVKMVDQGVKPMMDEPVTLFGTLKVGEMRENGYLVGIYSMDGVNMAGPLDE